MTNERTIANVPVIQHPARAHAVHIRESHGPAAGNVVAMERKGLPASDRAPRTRIDRIYVLSFRGGAYRRVSLPRYAAWATRGTHPTPATFRYLPELKSRRSWGHGAYSGTDPPELPELPELPE